MSECKRAHSGVEGEGGKDAEQEVFPQEDTRADQWEAVQVIRQKQGNCFPGRGNSMCKVPRMGQQDTG